MTPKWVAYGKGMDLEGHGSPLAELNCALPLGLRRPRPRIQTRLLKQLVKQYFLTNLLSMMHMKTSGASNHTNGLAGYAADVSMKLVTAVLRFE